MKTNRFSELCVLCGVGAAFAASARPSTAQATAVSSEDAKFDIELKDAPLSDALDMIYKAAGNPSHYNDPATSVMSIGSVTFPNISWHSAIRQLANQNNCRFYRDASGMY